MKIDVTLAHSVTSVPADGRDRPLVCGSHGGLYSAACALALRVPAAVFNDAGGGLEGAGTAGLSLLQKYGVPGLAVRHDTARIGDASDSWTRGRVGSLNAAAAALGIYEDITVPAACALLPHGLRTAAPDLAVNETRHTVPVAGGVHAVLLDSNSLVSAGDAGTIVVTGSHGGLLGGDPATAIKQAAFAAFYNDAGVGIDGAGISRLPALQARGIAGVAVAAATARIGDGLSAWRTGVVSFTNRRAADLGVAAGMTVQQACAALAQHLLSSPRKSP